MEGEERQVELKFIVAHKLFKKQNEAEVDKKLANELVPNGEEANIFVQNFQKANTTRKGLQYGSFITDPKEYPVQEFIAAYLSEQSPKAFLEMSIKIANRFETVLKGDLRSTGGYLIVFYYTDIHKGNIIAISVMSNKTDSGLDETTLKFTKNVVLNLGNMGLATTVMIDRWIDANSDTNYLTFMSGLKDISEYYKIKFLGCSNVQKSAVATKAVMDAIEGFYITKGYEEKDLQPIRERTVAYFDSHQDEAILQEIENILFPELDQQEEFHKYSEDNKLELSASFKPNRSSIKAWRHLVYNRKGIKVDISRERVTDQTVEYENNCLIIWDEDGSLGAEFNKFKKFEEETE